MCKSVSWLSNQNKQSMSQQVSSLRFLLWQHLRLQKELCVVYIKSNAHMKSEQNREDKFYPGVTSCLKEFLFPAVVNYPVKLKATRCRLGKDISTALLRNRAFVPVCSALFNFDIMDMPPDASSISRCCRFSSQSSNVFFSWYVCKTNMVSYQHYCVFVCMNFLIH